MESFKFIELFERANARLDDEPYIMIPDIVFEDLYPVLNTTHQDFLKYPQLRNVMENYIIARQNPNNIVTKSGETFDIRTDNRQQITEIDGVSILSYDPDQQKYYIDGLLFSQLQLDDFDAWKATKKGASLSRLRQDPSGVRPRPAVLGAPPATGRTSPPRPVPTGAYIPRRSNDTGEAHLASIKSLSLNPGSPRDISMSGWDTIKPDSVADRNALKEKCGSGCFMRPADNKFPICAKLSTTDNECLVDCRGLAAAKNRARFLQTKDPNTSTPYNSSTIDDLQKHFGCRKASGEAAAPRPRGAVKPIPVQIKSTAAPAPGAADPTDFRVGDVVYSSDFGGRNKVFGVITKITPTGKLRVEFLEKRRGRTIVNTPAEFKAEVFPSNAKTGKSVLTDSRGINEKQRLAFRKYFDNETIYDQQYL